MYMLDKALNLSSVKNKPVIDSFYVALQILNIEDW